MIDKLAEVGGLLARGKIKHSYPHSWRSKAPVIYRNTRSGLPPSTSLWAMGSTPMERPFVNAP